MVCTLSTHEKIFINGQEEGGKPTKMAEPPARPRRRTKWHLPIFDSPPPSPPKKFCN